jgi:hypothetical protein
MLASTMQMKLFSTCWKMGFAQFGHYLVWKLHSFLSRYVSKTLEEFLGGDVVFFWHQSFVSQKIRNVPQIFLTTFKTHFKKQNSIPSENVWYFCKKLQCDVFINYRTGLFRASCSKYFSDFLEFWEYFNTSEGRN